MKYLIYLHGFNSSPQSEKARLTQNYFAALTSQKNQPVNVIVPALPPEPLDAIEHIKDMVASLGRDKLLGFIGSSLGGYYSIYLQNYFSQPEQAQGMSSPKAVLINPAVRPYDSLEAYVGENQNMYTGERYTVKLSHMDDLKSLVVKPLVHPQLTYLLTQTNDEVLACQDGVEYLKGAKMWIQYGGSHAFEGFSAALPSIEAFCLRS